MSNLGQGVTEQYDARTIYQRSRMPRRQRRRWRRFRSKVLAVSEKELGTQQVVFNKVATYTNAVAGNQLLASMALYGLRSSTETLYNDLRGIGSLYGVTVSTTPSTPAVGLPVDNSSKLIFKSAVLDLTIRNSSFYGTSPPQPASEARIELDIYECQIWHTAEENGLTYDTLGDLFQENPARTPAIGGVGTEITIGLRGVTPFDLSYVLSRFKVKINRKTKYTIGNGDQITYQVRDPKRRVETLRELTNQDGFNKPGWTRVLFLVGKLSPGLTIGGTASTYTEQITVGITRKYVFKVENYTEDRTNYIVA
ncbi:capsid protein [Capybara virus 28_cap1_2580]|nr:capsid protein [Capybara virus 28_cap1_2580]